MNSPLKICLVLSFLALCACSWNAEVNKRATCKQLKANIAFNGATSITRNAEIQQSAEPLQQHTYDADDCSDYH